MVSVGWLGAWRATTRWKPKSSSPDTAPGLPSRAFPANNSLGFPRLVRLAPTGRVDIISPDWVYAGLRPIPSRSPPPRSGHKQARPDGKRIQPDWESDWTIQPTVPVVASTCNHKPKKSHLSAIEPGSAITLIPALAASRPDKSRNPSAPSLEATKEIRHYHNTAPWQRAVRMLQAVTTCCAVPCFFEVGICTRESLTRSKRGGGPTPTLACSSPEVE